MIPFLLKAFIFSFLYSFLVGISIAIVAFPLLALSDSKEPGTTISVVSAITGIILCAIQGIMIAAAVVVALEIEPARWDFAWYLVGFCFSVPMALAGSAEKPEQRFGILSSNISYILFCIFPQYIPPKIGDTAVSILL